MQKFVRPGVYFLVSASCNPPLPALLPSSQQLPQITAISRVRISDILAVASAELSILQADTTKTTTAVITL
jgi:hypothetical protein